jgi:hypothetical protein
MSPPRAPAPLRSVLVCLFGLCLALPASAQPVAGTPQDAPELGSTPPPPPLPPPPPPPVDLLRTHGQLLVRMALPPGIASAGLFLNNAFVAELPGGVLPAPLWLLAGGYAARVSAPALRSYEANIFLAPGQVIELAGALSPEAPIAPPGPGLALVPPPPRPRPARSAARIYRSILYGIGFTALGIVVVGGIAIGIACGAGKCKSSRSIDD